MGCAHALRRRRLMGRSALHLAVDSESMETVELLLDRVNFECIEESLLHAISMGATKIVKVLTLHLRISALPHVISFVIFYAGRVYSGKRNASVWCLSILCPLSVCLSHAAYTQSYSPGGSTDAVSVRTGTSARVPTY